MCIQLPEPGPEILLHRMQRGITRNHCAKKRPFLGMIYETCTHRILQQVATNRGEGIAPALLFFEYVIMRLMLKLLRR